MDVSFNCPSAMTTVQQKATIIIANGTEIRELISTLERFISTSCLFYKLGLSLFKRTYDKMVTINFNLILVRINKIYSHPESFTP